MKKNFNMTYDEATAYSLTVPWKVSVCPEGEKCWCRIIEPTVEIKDRDNEDIYIAASGCIPTVYAEYLVNLHNQYLVDLKNKEYLETTYPDGTPVKIYPVKEQVNTITKSEYPLLFSFLNNYDEESYHEEREHRRGSSFYVTETYFIDEDSLNEFKQEYELTEDLSHLFGYWQTEVRMWTDDWGFEDDFDCLSRVERKVRVIEEEYFTPIETNKSAAHA